MHEAEPYGRSLVAMQQIKKGVEVLRCVCWDIVRCSLHADYDTRGYKFDSVVLVSPYVLYPQDFDAVRPHEKHAWLSLSLSLSTIRGYSK